jgi:hypothetical protein
MKYMLLIHQGEPPLPGTPEWERLSENEQQRVSADYQAISSTAGVTPGVWMESPETATTVRVEGGRTLTTDGRSSPSRRRLAATSCTRRTTSTRRSSSRRGSRPHGWAARSRSGR